MMTLKLFVQQVLLAAAQTGTQPAAQPAAQPTPQSGQAPAAGAAPGRENVAAIGFAKDVLPDQIASQAASPSAAYRFQASRLMPCSASMRVRSASAASGRRSSS